MSACYDTCCKLDVEFMQGPPSCEIQDFFLPAKCIMKKIASVVGVLLLIYKYNVS